MTDERSQFEAWWASTKVACDYGSAWQGWQAARAAPAVSEAGPWVAGFDDTRAWVDSLDFTHDVRLYVNGDFEDDKQRFSYAEEIARRLNARAAPAQDTVPMPTNSEQAKMMVRVGTMWIEGAAPAQPTRSQKLAEAGFTRRPTTLETQMRGEDAAPAQPKCDDKWEQIVRDAYAEDAPAQSDVERCERESGVCVQVHSAERLGPCTPENCRHTAPAQPAGETT